MREYASALFELALEEKHIDKVFENFTVIVEAYKENPELGKLFSHPKISLQEKKRVIDEVFIGINTTFKHFLYVLVERGRITDIDKIYAVFREQYNDYNELLPVLAITSMKLSESQLDELKNQLKIKYRRKIELENHIDPTILGGVRLIVKDQVIDYTVQSQLSELRSILLNSN